MASFLTTVKSTSKLSRNLMGRVKRQADPRCSDALATWIKTEEGKKVQKKFRDELTTKLEGIQPGITSDL
jgi:hypothetical protein